MTAASELAARAQKLHQSGDFEQARRCYQESLAIEETADVLHGLGVLELQAGRAAEAVERLQAACELAPDHAQIVSNCGHAHAANGDHHLATRAYQRSLELAPNDAHTLAGLGNAWLAQSEFKRASRVYAQALELNPMLLDLWRCRATALSALGLHEAALRDLDRGDALAVQHRQPKSLPACLTRGNVLMSLGRATQALDCFQQVVDAQPGFVHGHISLGNAFRELDRAQEAKRSYQQALNCAPEHPEALVALGLAHQDSGDLNDARACFERAVVVAPQHGKANRLLSAMTLHTPEHPALVRLQKAVEDARTDARELPHLHFAYAKALEDCERYDDAFVHFSRGNELYRAGFEYDVSSDEQELQAIASAFDADYFHRRADSTRRSNDLPTPIFVVGMPRSGTSLIEQVLASHPEVLGAGELNDFELCFKEVLDETSPSLQSVDESASRATRLSQLDADQCDRVGQLYLRRLSAHQTRGWVVDKMPANFRWVALIRAVLPNAIVIHAQRHPLATCWSIYKHVLGTSGHAYSFSQDELARYYRACDGLMRHWTALDSQLVSVRYEALVADAEKTIRQLLQRCGLTWSDACLNFHRTRRTVKTLSATQVRRPMYTSAVRQWERYSHGLRPLSDSLQDLVDRYG